MAIRVKDLVKKLEQFEQNDTVFFVTTEFSDEYGYKSYTSFTCDEAEFIEEDGKLLIGYDNYPPDGSNEYVYL